MPSNSHRGSEIVAAPTAAQRTRPGAHWLATHRRWEIVVMLAGFGVVNYLDRQGLSVLAPTIRRDLGISTEQYSYVVSVFLAAYALGYAIAGRTLDRVGVRIGLAVALAFWSLTGMAHAAVVGWLSLAVVRFALGIGQSFNTPGGMKALAEWVPQRERGLASAIFSNSNSLGSVLAPPIVATLALWFGWRAALLVTGALGFVLLLLWWRRYEAPEADPRLSETERSYILANRSVSAAAADTSGSARVSYGAILRDRRCFSLCAIRFLTDPFAYFMTFWLLDYFQTVRGFSLQTVALLGWIPYLASPLLGGPLGGALSDWLVRRGVEPRVARLRLMGAAACFMPWSIVAVHTAATWLAIVVVTLLVAANACWSVNMLTIATELVPRNRVASLVSLGGIAGSLGGIAAMLLAGRLIATVGYGPAFTGLGFLHLTAFGILLLARLGRAAQPPDAVKS
jgi:ACS family hexuronate transporter-like MFS transporter